METDLLARIRAELEQRMAELRPLLGEYERLLEAADTLAAIEAAPEPEPAPPAPRAPRLLPTTPTLRTPRLLPTTPAPRAPRLLPTTPTLRTQPMLSALPLPPARPVPTPVEAPPAIPEPVREEFELEPEPEPERKPAMPSDVRQAILAALEHGSHTISELVMVTAMNPAEIRTNLSQLARQRKVTRVKREGDGKRAFALPASSAQT
ncbi:MAG TPA: hypothetical protein VG147_06700 [Solirubrobacteraceae bacterium]|nr:hypothetical protein [Solirubrobacteraceae bacterium]